MTTKSAPNGLTTTGTSVRESGRPFKVVSTVSRRVLNSAALITQLNSLYTHGKILTYTSSAAPETSPLETAASVSSTVSRRDLTVSSSPWTVTISSSPSSPIKASSGGCYLSARTRQQCLRDKKTYQVGGQSVKESNEIKRLSNFP